MGNAPTARHRLSNFLETWRGEASSWECDQLGHLNMKHYMAKAEQARQMFMMHLGLSHAFRDGALSSVRVREFHIRFVNEALPGSGLRFETALTGIGPDDVSLVHMMSHQDGRIAATIHEKLEHIYLRTQKSFNWPKRVMVAANDFMTPLPDIAKPRGLSTNVEMSGANLETLQKWGCTLIGRGVFTPDEADIFNIIAPQTFVGRLSDSVSGFEKAWPTMQDGSWRETGIIGVMLETRYRIHTYAEPGLPYVLFSGVAGITDKVRKLIHHFVNPYTGKPYASVIAINGLIDMGKRKMAYPSDANRKKVEAAIIPNLHA